MMNENLQEKIVWEVVRTTRGVFLLFLGLKLLGAIDWDWAWITSPCWIPLTIWGGYVLIQLIRAYLELYKERSKDGKR